MIGGKRCKTLREATTYQVTHHGTTIYRLRGKVYRYYVGTHLQWLNL